MFPTNRIELVQDAADATIAEREAAEAVGRYLKADGERTVAALDGGAALNRLKKSTPHGGFGAVLERLPISERTAQRWMRLAGTNIKPATVAVLGGIRRADEYLAAGADLEKLAAAMTMAVTAVRGLGPLVEEVIVAGEKALELSHDEAQRREIEALLGAWRAERAALATDL